MVTIATSETDGYQRFIRSAKLFDLDVEVGLLQTCMLSRIHMHIPCVTVNLIILTGIMLFYYEYLWDSLREVLVSEIVLYISM